jgi:type IV pilus assembly protein PilB
VQYCKRPAKIPKEVLLEEGFTEAMLKDATLFEPIGCDACKGAGYKGRVGIYEVVRITEAMARVIMEGGNSLEIADVPVKKALMI